MLRDAIGNSALYLNKFSEPESDDTLPMIFAILQNTIFRDLGVNRLKAPGSEMIHLENTMCLSGKSLIYYTPVQTEPKMGSGKGSGVVNASTASLKLLD